MKKTKLVLTGSILLILSFFAIKALYKTESPSIVQVKFIPKELTPDKVDQILTSSPLKHILNKQTSATHKNALTKMALFFVQNLEGILENVDNEKIVTSLYEQNDIIMECSAKLFGQDGIDAIYHGYKLTVNTTEKKMRSLESGKYFSGKIISMPKVDKTECLRLFGTI